MVLWGEKTLQYLTFILWAGVGESPKLSYLNIPRVSIFPQGRSCDACVSAQVSREVISVSPALSAQAMAADATLDCVPTLDLWGGACFKSILVRGRKCFNQTSGFHRWPGCCSCPCSSSSPWLWILWWDQAANVRIFSVRAEWPASSRGCSPSSTTC